MARTRIKFCGITRGDDLRAAAQLGVDAVGLVFAPESPRVLTLEKARALREQWPLWVEAVALFVDPSAKQVRSVIEAARPTCLQFHGAEDADFCKSFNMPYIKAIGYNSNNESNSGRAAHEGSAGAFLVDTQTGSGGSGKAFDWARWAQESARVPQPSSPWLLAGGLSPDNVAEALRCLRPWGVDVSSGIESERGVKDVERMSRFVAAVRNFDSEMAKKNGE